VGREARAWFEPEREPPGISAPLEHIASEPNDHHDVVQAAMARATPNLASAIPRPSALGIAAPIRPAPEPRAPAAEKPAAKSVERAATAALTTREAPAPKPLLHGKMLSLYDVNAKRSLRVKPFTDEGVPDAEAFGQLRSFLRCRRSGHEMDMDPRLIAVLSRISQHFGDATVQIISAHRKPDGVVTSEKSQHAFGTAADIRVAGVSVETLKEAAHALGATGVGVYPKSGFVHVDVRHKPYAWRDNGQGAIQER
jgi:uncharacterized protein YcbK (DUF882 family)